MKKLQINWPELELAFESSPLVDSELGETDDYLDSQTGQVFAVDETVREEVTSIIEDLEEAGMIDQHWTDEDVCRTSTYEALPDWMKPSVLSAFNMEYRTNTEHFHCIPGFQSRESFQWMEAFLETVPDDSVREQLAEALRKRKPFRQFRDAVGGDRRLSASWQSFEMARQRESIIAWLHSIDVDPLNPDEGLFEPSFPDLRKIMFDQVRQFVELARMLPGVERIALIGSLVSDKEFPNDIDLLVTISDDCQLAPLAKFSRQLVGHMLTHNSGADVFLASPSGEYLGRTCPWKRCGPGIRASCYAQSCGRRHYLHDDFGSIRLSQDLIQHPPVLLWPTAHANVSVPPDVREQLIDPLSL